MGLAVGLDVQRRVLVGELGEGARELDLVVAVGGGDRERVHRLGVRAAAAAAPRSRGEHGAGAGAVEPGQRHDLAGLGRADILLLAAEQPVDAADPHVAQHRAVLDGAAPDPGQRQLAGMRAGSSSSAPGRPVSRPRREAQQRRPGRRARAPPCASASSRRRTPMSCSATPMNTGTTWSAPSVLRRSRRIRSVRRLLVLEQQAHQIVVEIGQRLQHLAAGRLLALEIVGRHRDDVGSLAAPDRRAPPH